MPFKPGVSGNPGGRPRIVQSVRRRAQNHVEEALDVALKVMKDDGNKPSERLAAAVKVLQIAGVAFSAESAGDAGEPTQPLTPQASEEELLEAVAQGEG